MTDVMFWVEKLNYYLLQWFFVRLGRVETDDGVPIRWALLRWPYPMSGWDGRPWKFLGGSPRGC